MEKIDGEGIDRDLCRVGLSGCMSETIELR
jgi:hypothetical protein